MIDLNKLPIVEDQISWLRFMPFKKYPDLKDLGEISERIYGVYHFNKLSTDNNYESLQEKCLIRACINEFVSLTELTKKVYPNLAIENLSFPLFHFIKELRAINFHVTTFNSSSTTELLSSVNRTNGDVSAEDIPFEIFIISNCNVQLFSLSRNFNKYYNNIDFEKTIKWVNEKQNIWGINHIINLGFQQYCEILNKAINNENI